MAIYDFKQLKAQVSIDQILTAYGLAKNLRRTDHGLIGACPIHNGDNPTAFRVDLKKGLFHCFTGCGGGDAVELVRKIKRCSYPQAAYFLNQLCRQRPMPPVTIDHATDTSPFRPFRGHITLNPVCRFLQINKSIHIDTAIHFETGIAAYSRFLQNAVAVRVHDMIARPLGYCARRLDPIQIKHWGKWRFAKYFPKSQILYNAHRALPFRHHGVIVVECPWAVMRLTQAGFPNAVALLGTTVSKQQQDWLLKAPAIVLMLDADPAGKRAAARIVKQLGSLTRIMVHQLPEGLDPDDLTDQQLHHCVAQYGLFSL